MTKRIIGLAGLFATFTLIAVGAWAGVVGTETVTGSALDRLQAAHKAPLQADLRERIVATFGSEHGFLVTGPLWLDAPVNHKYSIWYAHNRVVCPSRSSLGDLVNALRQTEAVERVAGVNWRRLTAPRNYEEDWAIACIYEGDTVVFVTLHHTRYLMWASETLLNRSLGVSKKAMGQYAKAVARHFFRVDTGATGLEAPRATAYELPASLDLYAAPPPYVIEGYQNYKDFMSSHAVINTDFASGILSFVPGDSLLGALAETAPATAYPNKEYAMLQSEYRTFFLRGGSPALMQTLTREGFDTLQPGEYFFAVGLNGTVRFGRELLREEVEKLEKETGRKVPRANHAFLFPGEPVLAAGAFFVGSESEREIVRVNAKSGHYFYSNVTPTIREDIAEESDHYLLTLGHFFNYLDRLRIPYDRVVISKF
jgi:hypothetical protein